MNISRKRCGLSLLVTSLCLFILLACQARAPRVEIAPSLTPISVPMFESTRPIAFGRIAIKMPKHRPIGSMYSGVFCIKEGEVTVSGGRYELDFDQFNEIFRSEFRLAGYNIVGDPDVLFGDPEIQSAEYLVAGLIDRIEANVCYSTIDFSYSSAAVYMEVEWQIFDTLRREVVRKLRAQGSSEVGDRFNGVNVAFGMAFAHAARNLLANRQFYQLVQAGESDGQPRVSLEESHDYSLSPAWDAERPELRGGIDVDHVAQAVAVVRSARGDGSGFVIGKGLLVTNERVVGGVDKVRLIFGDGAQIDANVAISDARRGVALIRFADSFIRVALPVRTTAVEIGSDVYSFDTSLAEDDAGTLFKSTVGAYREVRGLNYLQSDVVINSGGSGGPLVDGNGAVVGISAAGMLDEVGAQQDNSFFIPIKEAMMALGL